MEGTVKDAVSLTDERHGTGHGTEGGQRTAAGVTKK